MLTVYGKDGVIESVRQGTGLGIREHDDVMLKFGYSRKTYLEITIPAGQFAVIKSVVPVGLNHHAEARILETFGTSIRYRIYKNVNNANFPAQVSVMPITNERGPSIITLSTTGTKYTYHGISVANPIVSGDLIDNYPIWVLEGAGNKAGSPETSQSVKGRYYDSSTYAVVIQNIGTIPTVVYYQYSWHEFV